MIAFKLANNIDNDTSLRLLKSSNALREAAELKYERNPDPLVPCNKLPPAQIFVWGSSRIRVLNDYVMQSLDPCHRVLQFAWFFYSVSVGKQDAVIRKAINEVALTIADIENLDYAKLSNSNDLYDIFLGINRFKRMKSGWLKKEGHNMKTWKVRSIIEDLSLNAALIYYVESFIILQSLILKKNTENGLHDCLSSFLASRIAD